jgi:putative peptidoglycan lipid II flippase
MAFFVLSRALGFLREIVIARQFGTSAELDAYLAAFRIPDLLFALMAGGALGSALIPVLSEYLARDDERAAWKLASAVLNWVVLAMGGVATLAALGAPVLVRTVIAPGFTPAQHALTAELMRWMLLSTLIFGISGIVMGILNARQHFLLPALAPAVYNLAIALGAWLLGPSLGVRGAVVGVVVGAAAHLLVQLPALRRFDVRYWPRLAPHDPGVREVGRLMAPRALGLAAVELNHLVNVVLASGLAAGSLAALNYGRMIMLLPEGVIAQSVAIAAFPTFSALVARDEHAALQRVFRTTLRSVLYLTLPATVGLILLREPLVVALLQRGAFDARSSAATAWALLFYALGLASHAALEIITRAFYAAHDTRTPVGVGVAAMLANALLSVALIALFRQLGVGQHAGNHRRDGCVALPAPSPTGDPERCPRTDRRAGAHRRRVFGHRSDPAGGERRIYRSTCLAAVRTGGRAGRRDVWAHHPGIALRRASRPNANRLASRAQADRFIRILTG